MNLQVRKPLESDLEHLKKCLGTDEFHKLQDPSWWTNNGELITFYDEKGPVLHVKAELALRVHVQFDPTQRKRNAVALKPAFQFVKEHAIRSGIKEIIFDSIYEPLINFCKKHLLFNPTKNDFNSTF